MNDFVNAFLAKYAPRLAGVAASFLVGEAAKYHITLDVQEMTALMLIVYAAVHRLVSRYTNPGDATKTVLIDHQKAIVDGAPPVSVPVPAAAAPPQVSWEHGEDEGVI